MSAEILFVDDNKLIREASVDLFKSRGIKVLTASDAAEALELFKEHTPDIVITDVNMPVMDGVELAREIRSINADATYIVLTAYSNEIVFEKFKDLGFCAYLLKPIDFEDLFATIEKCVVESKRHEAHP